MKVTIIGTGYVGLVTGACLAEVGNEVFCLDLDQNKVDLLNNGVIPIHEAGLEELVVRNHASGRLIFSSDIAASVHHGDIQFIAVGTPPDQDGAADLQHVFAAARSIGQHMHDFKVVVDKSTVPVGTASRVQEVILEQLTARGTRIDFAVVSNPEFLKEGAAVEDFMRPDRIVIGCDDTPEGQRARSMMKQLYSPFNRNRERTFWMDVRSAEFTKYAANAMLATRISFMNELANLADKVGVDIEAVRHGIGSDPRIGYSFLYAGCGYGGSCFPKDVQALRHTAAQYDHRMQILQAVAEVNERQRHVLGRKIIQRFGDDLGKRHFAIWGLAFKPNTDDMRHAPSRALLRQLLKHGASVAVYDPVAMNEARRALADDFAEMPSLLEQIRFCDSAAEALQDADALAIVTEWKAFRSPDLNQIKSLLKEPVIFDGRNLFEPWAMANAGIEYHGIGRTAINRT
ncbi:UDP-glucose dehydrogenase family protein [Noviherbaspirillum malthae]|uniref:UDP-glucose dehydrogenase family protein n=1 Tax=Noviherbaspirillum malthae TaxID=1260987 RepID=UPI00188E9593|nr:UDP-glucose/GDP-mannose dehydrogenase family protein [Noviherbaspirillum malthae]